MKLLFTCILLCFSLAFSSENESYNTVKGNSTGHFHDYTSVEKFYNALKDERTSFKALSHQQLADLIAQLESRINPYSPNYYPFQKGHRHDEGEWDISKIATGEIRLYTALLWQAFENAFQRKGVEFELPVNLGLISRPTNPQPETESNVPIPDNVQRNCDELLRSQEPILFVYNDIYSAQARETLRAFLQKTSNPRTAMINLSDPFSLQNFVHLEFGLGIVTANKFWSRFDRIVFTEINTESSMSPYNVPLFLQLITWFDSNPNTGKKLMFLGTMLPQKFKTNMHPKIGSQASGPLYSHVQRLYHSLFLFLPVSKLLEFEQIPPNPPEVKSLHSSNPTKPPQSQSSHPETIKRITLPPTKATALSCSKPKPTHPAADLKVSINVMRGPSLLWITQWNQHQQSYMPYLQGDFSKNHPHVTIINCGEYNGFHDWMDREFGQGRAPSSEQIFAKFPKIILANVDEQVFKNKFQLHYIFEMVLYIINQTEKKLAVAAFPMSNGAIEICNNGVSLNRLLTGGSSNQIPHGQGFRELLRIMS